MDNNSHSSASMYAELYQQLNEEIAKLPAGEFSPQASELIKMLTTQYESQKSSFHQNTQSL